MPRFISVRRPDAGDDDHSCTVDLALLTPRALSASAALVAHPGRFVVRSTDRTG